MDGLTPFTTQTTTASRDNKVNFTIEYGTRKTGSRRQSLYFKKNTPAVIRKAAHIEFNQAGPGEVYIRAAKTPFSIPVKGGKLSSLRFIPMLIEKMTETKVDRKDYARIEGSLWEVSNNGSGQVWYRLHVEDFQHTRQPAKPPTEDELQLQPDYSLTGDTKGFKQPDHKFD